MSPTRREFLAWSAWAAGGLTLTACSVGGPKPVASPADTGSVSTAESLASLALWTAQRGADAGSYGIGGALVESATGRVLQTMPNRVFRTLSQGGTFVEDPTAHGERQLMSWYLAQRDTLDLTDPSGLTVVTTLDPCLMCASSLLAVGVNVGVVAIDDYSGVNFDSSGSFTDLPEPLRAQALATFGYYAVDGGRSFQGSRTIAYADEPITQATLDASANLYTTSAETVRSARRESGVVPSRLTDPSTDPAAIDVIRAFQVTCPEAFTVKVRDPRLPDRRVYDVLVDVVRRSPGSTNAVAFLDPFGNLVTAQADQQSVNLLSTAFALCSRTYAQTRYALIDAESTTSIAEKTLTNPNYGTFVFLEAPDPTTATGMFDIGAYGSTMGGAAMPSIPSAFQYFELPSGVTERELQDVVYPLPPLYSQNIKISPQRVVGVS
ncbi:MAG: nucleoside deaminase [Candidatus Nanopelagicales bacterium]